MKKQAKFIVISCIVLVVLAAAIVMLLMLPDTQEGGDNESSSGATALISQSAKNIEQIVVNNSGGEYTLMVYSVDYEVSDESSSESSETETATAMSFTMQEHPEYTLDVDRTEALAADCASLSATRTINPGGNTDADYGLDSPRATVKVRFSDSSERQIEVGDDAPGDEGTYIKVDGDSKIYLTDSDSVSSMLVEMLQMFDREILDELSDDDSVTSINVSGTGREAPLTFENNSLSAISTFYMSSPIRAACDSDSVETLCDYYIFPMEADSVTKIDITDEDIKEYGLSEPYYILDIKTEQTENRIIVSEPDDNGDSYIMCDGSKIIYKIADDAISFMSSDGNDFSSDDIIYPNITKLKSATLTYSGAENEYTLTHEKKVNEDEVEITSTTVQLSGEEIAVNRFETMLKNIGTLTRADRVSAVGEGAKPMFTIKFVYEDDMGTDTLELYEHDDKAIIVLNGDSVGTTELETANTLVSDARLLSENRDIEAFATEEESSDAAESADTTESAEASEE